MTEKMSTGWVDDASARVWLSRSRDQWEGVQAVHRSDSEVQIVNTVGESETLQLADVSVLPRNPPHLEHLEVQDLVHLQFLNAPSILYNLKMRFEAEEAQVYTATGPILIAINPWRDVPLLYDRPRMDSYAESYLRDLSRDADALPLPPHIFKVADSAYRALLREGRDQSILVSGESGSGKTETTKHVMNYLAYVSSANFARAPLSRAETATTDRIRTTESKVLSSNPLLESFGNAMTLRNDNSSRFGKYVDLNFAVSGRLTGGAVQTYLIETSRVVLQTSGERNFHIFYQLLEGAEALDPNLVSSLSIANGVAAFAYVRGTPSARGVPGEARGGEGGRAATRGGYGAKGAAEHGVKGSPDGGKMGRGRDLLRTVQAMDSVGISEGDKEAVLAAIAAVLHLGNIQVEGGKEGDEETALGVAATPSAKAASVFSPPLLQVSESDLANALCLRTQVNQCINAGASDPLVAREESTAAGRGVSGMSATRAAGAQDSSAPGRVASSMYGRGGAGGGGAG
ncbi:P-loop containing nucleoside triphosphate hydrolase protein, partial [Baffinella frigidus]